MSDEDIQQAAEYFAALKPGGWVKVVEADTVPKSYVSVKGRQRLPLPGGGTEPLGNRIIELPAGCCPRHQPRSALRICRLRPHG